MIAPFRKRKTTERQGSENKKISVRETKGEKEKRRDGWQAGWKVRLLLRRARGGYYSIYCHLLLLLLISGGVTSHYYLLLSSLPVPAPPAASDGDSGSSFR